MADTTLASTVTAAPDKPLPHHITMDGRDNVAIIANDGGLPAGTRLSCGVVLVDRVPQGHKVALVDLALGDPVRRYNVVIGRARDALPAGSWVHERLLDMPAARSLHDLPVGTALAADHTLLAEQHTFLGFRNADGTVGTRNILAITTDRAVRGRRHRLRGQAHQAPS